MFILVLSAGASLAAMQIGAQEPPRAVHNPEIVVEGTVPDDGAEIVPVGSRIARPDQGWMGNGQVATRTGINGLTPGSGVDPFSGGTIQRKIRECRSGGARISQSLLCQFAELQSAAASGDFGRARNRLDRILETPGLTDEDKYHAHRQAWLLAEADGGDARDRAKAIEGMLATQAMPREERLSALRSLAPMALRAGENLRAAQLLEQAVAMDGSDARSRASLAALYSQSGRVANAQRQIREAIASLRSRGEPVPADWIAFSAAR